MSSDSSVSDHSVVGQALGSGYDDLTHLGNRSDPNKIGNSWYGWATHPVETGTAWAYASATKRDPPDTQTPGAPPTRGGANQVALNDQLNNEMNMRQSRTGGLGANNAGLLDNQPVTASRVLLGS